MSAGRHPSLGHEPVFSIVVPTCGRPELLDAALDSVRVQRFTDWECIVVNDDPGSDVRIPDDSRFRLMPAGSRRGAAAARNAGLDAARGRFVTFLDDDDMLATDRLGAVLPHIDDQSAVLAWVGDARTRPVGHVWARRLNGDVSGRILDGPVPHVGAAVLPRSRAPRFDESFSVSEDVEWWLRAARATDVSTLPRPLYLLRQHSGQRQTGKTRERLQCRLRLLDKHADYFAAHPRAHAYQLLRAGGLAQTVGDNQLAQRLLAQSVRRRPTPSAVWHYTRARFDR